MKSIIFPLLVAHQAHGYVHTSIQQGRTTNCNSMLRTTTFLHAKNKKSKKLRKPSNNARGFGKASSNSSESPSITDPMEKTYDQTSAVNLDNIGIEEHEAMEGFFATYQEWHPLFASIAAHDQVPASTHIPFDQHQDPQNTKNSSLQFTNDTPWNELPSTPSGDDKEEKIATIALVLDAFQKALTDIPVSEKLYSKNADDNNDLHFLEEGRRMLVLQRFHVLGEDCCTEDELFQTCWSEIYHLVSKGGGDMGSLIILDGDDEEEEESDGEEENSDGAVELIDLEHFVDTKIRLPLLFLGLGDMLEVASFERGRQCVRLIQNLGAIPSLEERDRKAKDFQ